MAQGQKITEEEWQEIQRLLDKGFSPLQMPSVKRSSNAIYSIIKKKGVILSGRSVSHKKKNNIHFELPEDVDFTKLSDDILFHPKMFPSF